MSPAAHCLLLVFAVLTTPLFGQQPSPLDARVPREHEYILAIWFKTGDKAKTFQSRIIDPAARGYDRNAWAKSNAQYNAPGSGWHMELLSVRTSKGIPKTERQQLTERIEQLRASSTRVIVEEEQIERVILDLPGKPTTPDK